MLDFYFIRHGQTQWNVDKKLQGRTDICLNQCGQEQIRNYQLPANLNDIQWFTSPLLRAVETAELLKVKAIVTPELIEMSWGEWEGWCIAQLRQDDSQNCAEQEVRGLDLTPPAGESPRIVGERVTNWARLREIEYQQRSENTHHKLGCVTHKGVIRAIYALASGWNMQDKAPDKLDFHCCQHFTFQDGVWSIAELNIKLCK